MEGAERPPDLRVASCLAIARIRFNPPPLPFCDDRADILAISPDKDCTLEGTCSAAAPNKNSKRSLVPVCFQFTKRPSPLPSHPFTRDSLGYIYTAIGIRDSVHCRLQTALRSSGLGPTSIRQKERKINGRSLLLCPFLYRPSSQRRTQRRTQHRVLVPARGSAAKMSKIHSGSVRPFKGKVSEQSAV